MFEHIRSLAAVACWCADVGVFPTSFASNPKISLDNSTIRVIISP